MALAKINGLFRLTRDIEVSYTAGGTAVGKLGLACSEKYKDKETTLFLDATAFGKVVEILQQYAGTKGTQIYLSGKLLTESWQDKNTGSNRSKTTMIIEGFDFVSSGKPQSGQGQNQQPSQQQPNMQQPQQGYAAGQQAPAYAPNDFQDDEPPF